MVKRRTGLDPLAYMGVEPSTPSQFVQDNRNPTTNDYDNFNLMAVWLNTVTYQVWMLVDKANFVATWIPFASSVSALNTLTADTGTNPVPPTANNIDLFGGTGIETVGNAGASLITINVDGDVATQYDADVGSAIPVANILNIVGGPHVQTTGAGNTITISPLGSVAVSIPTDAGVATPAGGILNVFGGNNITTTGVADTVTIDVTGTTNNALQRGNATGSLTSLALGTDGQVVIGATGGAPAFADLTSVGGTILFTPGANTLNLEAAGPGFLTDIVCDVGNAAPVGGILNVLGGDNITTTGDTVDTITVAVSGTTQYAPQMGNAAGSLDDIGVMTDGELIIGQTGLAPVVNTLTAGTGISITNGPGTITIDATGASTGGVKTTIFNASGMWTKDANAKTVRFVIYSGGGGGGSGARSTNGTGGSGYVTGGGGGACLGYTDYMIDADYLGATETVVVAASGTGGAAVLVNDTDGNGGGVANSSSFGTTNIFPGGRDAPYLFGFGNANGGLKSGATAQGASQGNALLSFSGLGNSNLPPNMQGGGQGQQSGGTSPSGVAFTSIWGSATGGGGGGSHRNGAAPTAGGDGGQLLSIPTSLYTYGVPGTGGAAGVSGGNGSNGSGSNSPFKIAGTGGGGGGGHPTNPGNGGNGGFPGGGGGGGGAVANGNPSGAGGDGGAGQVIIYEYLGF